MPKYSVVLSSRNEPYQVHKAGCRDVARELPYANSHYDTEAPDPIRAALDADDRALGWSEQDVRVFPCTKHAT